MRVVNGQKTTKYLIISGKEHVQDYLVVGDLTFERVSNFKYSRSWYNNSNKQIATEGLTEFNILPKNVHIYYYDYISYVSETNDVHEVGRPPTLQKPFEIYVKILPVRSQNLLVIISPTCGPTSDSPPILHVENGTKSFPLIC